MAAGSNGYLVGVASLLDCFPRGVVFPVSARAEADAVGGCSLVNRLPSLDGPSLEIFLLATLEGPSAVFLARMLLFPRSADLRLSFCLSAARKNDRPLSSDLLLSLLKSVLELVSEDFASVTEELLLEFLSLLFSNRLPGLACANLPVLLAFEDVNLRFSGDGLRFEWPSAVLDLPSTFLRVGEGDCGEVGGIFGFC